MSEFRPTSRRPGVVATGQFDIHEVMSLLDTLEATRAEHEREKADLRCEVEHAQREALRWKEEALRRPAVAAKEGPFNTHEVVSLLDTLEATRAEHEREKADLRWEVEHSQREALRWKTEALRLRGLAQHGQLSVHAESAAGALSLREAATGALSLPDVPAPPREPAGRPARYWLARWARLFRRD